MRWAFPTILIGLSVAFFFFAVDPLYKEILVLQAEAESFNAALSKSRELQKVRDDLLNTYNSFSVDDLDRLEKMLPDNIDNVRLLLDVNAIASKYGMSIKSTTIREVSGAPSATAAIGDIDFNQQSHGSMILGFSVSGPYEVFLSFLEDLEKSLRLVDVTSISFLAGENDFYQYNVEIQTYWLK